MSSYLTEVADATRDHEAVERGKFRTTQEAMAKQAIEIARILQAADSEEEQEPLGAYMEAAAVIVSAQANGLALRRVTLAVEVAGRYVASVAAALALEADGD